MRERDPFVEKKKLVFKFTKVEDCSRVHATAKPQSDVNRKWIFLG